MCMDFKLDRRRAVVLDVLALPTLARMADEQVRLWRPGGDARVLLMAGRTTSYAIDPRGEYVFGIVAGQPMRSIRGRERHLVRPGEMVAWDPSAGHSGSAVGGGAWSSRLMILEVADLAAIAGDEEHPLLDDLAFPDPVVADARLAAGFLRLHRALEGSSTRLETDELLAEWLHAVIRRAAPARPPAPARGPHDALALRRACDYLAEHPARNVGLDELAAAAGIGKFRLVRIFRQRTGLPPHALQLAHRIRDARRLLERGHTIVDTATATGFADQSHLHRHFTRSIGLTPGAYQRRIGR
jgi:AraC-like DNA-binding protein